MSNQVTNINIVKIFNKYTYLSFHFYFKQYILQLILVRSEIFKFDRRLNFF